MQFSSEIHLLLGILLGMLFFQRTGISCGGIISPGLMAMEMDNPLGLVVSLAAALLTWGLLTGAVRVWGVFGRQRVALAMALALVIKIILSMFYPVPSLWLGWVVPGLMGADFQRQGFIPTISGAVCAAVAAAMCAGLLFSLFSAWGGR
ncbi:MAG: poly-gamma-glutamate biosynthesis protein PgsC/CapC [Desulfarculaceae bacterium]